MMANDTTSPYGLLGRTLGHSWSAAIHQRLGSSPYALFEREPHEVERFIREGSWKGLNVTIPYKREAARLADTVSARVVDTGAANTLVHLESGQILADNTDVLGFAWMLNRFARRELGVSATEAFGATKALVLGSGGASAAVTSALEGIFGAHAVVVSRTGSVNYQNLPHEHADATLVVNTTPVGMYPDCPHTPLEESTLASLSRLKAVIDIVYNPERTGLCLAAERLGIPWESGLAMLVAQAGYSSGLWLAREPTDMALETIEHEMRREMRNIIIIGMPGSGKTSAGRRLARLSGRPFADLDDTLEVEYGLDAGEYIERFGEDGFRHRESEIASRYGARSGLVISCGGGIVCRKENYNLLHQNGIIVLLDRPLAQLATQGRPISIARGVNALAAERMPLYERWADITLTCTGSAEGDAQALAKTLGLVKGSAL